MYRYSFQARVYRGWGVPENSIYLQPIYDTYDFVVRGITRREYETWQVESANLSDLEGRILEEAVLVHPSHFGREKWNWDNVLAGIADQVLNKIYDLSGLGNKLDPEVSNPVEEYLGSIVARYDLVILMGLDQYKLSDLLDMDHREWNMLVGLAQYKLSLLGIDSDEILYPGEKKKTRGGVIKPSGSQISVAATGKDPQAMGGAQPFFSNAQPKYTDSPYPPGHPKNPAIVGDKSLGFEKPMTFQSK